MYFKVTLTKYTHPFKNPDTDKTTENAHIRKSKYQSYKYGRGQAAGSPGNHTGVACELFLPRAARLDDQQQSSSARLFTITAVIYGRHRRIINTAGDE